MPESSHRARLQHHLDRVSRSFAVCIAELSEPLREWTSVAYLFCRLLDTVEDAAWPNAKARAEALGQLAHLIQKDGVASGALHAWMHSLPDGIADAESQLVADAPWLFDVLGRLELGPRNIIVNTVCKMAQGMQHYARRWESEDELRLRNLCDVNRYCFFVAGIVGSLLSQLFAASWASFQFTDAHRCDAHHFGLFLQKVNLLKDWREDESQKRFLLPDRKKIIAGLKKHATHALQYILALPSAAKEFRTFCAWSLFLGAKSLAVSVSEFQEDSGLNQTSVASKIPRDETLRLFTMIREISCDNDLLIKSFEEAWQHLRFADKPDAKRMDEDQATTQSQSSWFTELVGDWLAPEMHQQLGLR